MKTTGTLKIPDSKWHLHKEFLIKKISQLVLPIAPIQTMPLLLQQHEGIV